MDDSTCTWETLVATRKEVEALGPFPLRLWFIGIPYGTQACIETLLRDAGGELADAPRGLDKLFSFALEVAAFNPLSDKCPLGDYAPWFARRALPGVWIEMSNGEHQRLDLDEGVLRDTLRAALVESMKEKWNA